MALPQDDRDLIREFEQETLDLAAFHHADHVRLARAYLLRYSLMQVLARFPNSLKTLATRKGHPEIYHETITCAYIVLIHDRMQRGSGGDDWASFSRANPDLLNWAEPILNRYYSPETLKSEKARGAFVVPDRDLDAPQVSRRCSGS
jgi:hypothetical protein